MERRELIFMDAKSSKFWNIELDGSSHTVNYGRTGTNGQTKTKDFDSEEKAKKDFDKLVNAKLKKGYTEAGGDTTSSSVEDGGMLPFVAFSSVKKLGDMYSNVKTFTGKRVAEYQIEKGPAKGGNTIYRFFRDWENDNLIPSLEHFLETDAASEASGIVIGCWSGDEPDASPQEVIDLLVENKKKLSSLNAIFLGDVTSEENEMSWIHQCDVSPLLGAFKDLQLLRTRGGEELKLEKPAHKKLRALAMETGGMDVSVVRSVCQSKFPSLEYLELWLGTDEYGGSCSVQDLQPILSGKLFPKLKYLGFRNCDFADDIASVIVNSPIIERIEILDLSLGTLSDEGANALLSLPEDGPLQTVNLHHNYAGKDAIKKLKAHKINFDVANPSHMETDDEWRFVAVGE